ncbi:MAG: hypothetical protein IT260_17535 [Saprospiraceae bacterium]|nr:hypothetical protein [Saprospiraceae bacterium]
MLPALLTRRLSRLFGYSHLPPEEIEYRSLALTIIVFIAVLDLTYNVAYFAFGYPFVWWTTAVYLLVAGINLYRLQHGARFRQFRNTQIALTIALPLVAQITHGGFTGGSGVVLAAFLAPMGALMFAGIRTARWSFYGYLAALVLAGVWEYFTHPRQNVLPEEIHLLFFMFNIGFTAAVAYFLMEGFLRNKSALLDLVREEHQKADNLLLDIFPADTARELKENGAVQAKSYARATVLFTDFIGFSAFAGELPAEELVEQLDFYFSAFDDIVRRHGLEKIKTIGDAYMCAGGLPAGHDEHAVSVVQAALDIRAFILHQRLGKIEQYGYPFDIRIGIHTGPVVAGVVGSRKIAYDIWGATVNIAARMEQLCEPDRINISQATYALVKDAFECQYRGRFPAKHVGEVDMYYVNGVR